MKLISYRRTAVYWYNFDTEAGATYNIEPEIFREITGVSKEAVLGCTEVTEEELWELTENARLIKLPEGFEWVV
ncbi:hypothetical protein JOC94_004716 [Bacillus thermophilus]|uniref:Uncharacterized protein n=1 Tax=Siminovitchia thermophila TaxID=1245522 RepID=A0ABS2RDF3_9BACI|nr:hypothetical protein [Siminovitchia thermophila]MBM7717685.1 hypothetical protein [Siminovitchia thermophila]ONK24366.1 hypothetical protein BLX87_05485 [Bacillus sp. VT-16-64]